jgi:hypothetical protein
MSIRGEWGMPRSGDRGTTGASTVEFVARRVLLRFIASSFAPRVKLYTPLPAVND